MATLSAIFKLTDRYTPTMDKINKKTEIATRKLERASAKLDKMKAKLDKTKHSSNNAGASIISLAKGFATLQAVKGITNLSDDLSSAKARLDAINDGSQTTADLQKKIMNSANAARTPYIKMADTLGQIVQRTGDLFKSNDEALVFAENLSKMFAIGGASQEGSAAATTQLLQALGSGVLRGEELNSVFEQSPNIIQKIADYMGVGIGKIRELAEQGKITSEVLKNSLLGATDEINENFDKMPTTFAQAMSILQNNVITIIEPAMIKLAGLAQLIVDNWGFISTVLVSAGVGFAVYSAGVWAAQAATIAADIATKGLGASIMAIPFIGIIAAIASVITWFTMWAGNLMGFQALWLTVIDSLITAWDTFLIIFHTIGIMIIEFLFSLGEAFIQAGDGIQNAMSIASQGVVSSIEWMVNKGISLLNTFINALNKIEGVHIDPIEKATFGAENALKAEAERQQRASELNSLKEKNNSTIDKMNEGLNSRISKARSDKLARETAISDAIQSHVDKKTTKATSLGGYTPDVPKFDVSGVGGGGTPKPVPVKGAGSGGAVKVEMSNEDLRYLRDIAERDYINKFSTNTLAPNINVSFGDVHENADAKKISGQIAKILKEEIAMVAEGAY